MPAERLPMRKVREVLRRARLRRQRAGDCPVDWRQPLDGGGIPASGGGDRARLADPARAATTPGSNGGCSRRRRSRRPDAAAAGLAAAAPSCAARA